MALELLKSTQVKRVEEMALELLKTKKVNDVNAEPSKPTTPVIEIKPLPGSILEQLSDDEYYRNFSFDVPDTPCESNHILVYDDEESVMDRNIEYLKSLQEVLDNINYSK